MVSTEEPGGYDWDLVDGLSVETRPSEPASSEKAKNCSKGEFASPVLSTLSSKHMVDGRSCNAGDGSGKESQGRLMETQSSTRRGGHQA